MSIWTNEIPTNLASYFLRNRDVPEIVITGRKARPGWWETSIGSYDRDETVSASYEFGPRVLTPEETAKYHAMVAEEKALWHCESCNKPLNEDDAFVMDVDCVFVCAECDGKQTGGDDNAK